MIKKQVDFDVRVQPLAENANNQLTLANLKSQYPSEDGWELINTLVAQVSGNVVNIVFTFAKYEYESEAVAYEPVAEGADYTEAPKRRGRPKKVAEEVAE